MSDTDKQFEDESMENIITKLRETFKDEAYELLAELETALLELEKTPTDMELIGRVFRALHTIKGSGATCEFSDIALFTHEVETVLDLVRKGKTSAVKEIVNMTLVARDHIKAMFDRYYRGGSVDEAKQQEILAFFKKMRPDTGHVPVAEKSPVPAETQGKNVTYRIRFQPALDMFSRGTDPVSLLRELRRFGPCKIVAQTETIPYLEEIKAQSCYTFWDVILTTDRGLNAIQDVFIFVKDSADLKIDIIDEEGRLEDETAYKRLGEILLERGDLTTTDLDALLKTKKRFGELLVETGVVSGSKVESALLEQQHVREMRELRQHADFATNIRVSTHKLDSLVNLVGELVTAQARLSQTAFSYKIPELQSIAEDVERLTADLRDNAMSIRMLQIGTTFSKFKRLVRDLSRELGKDIELIAEGAETELDKTVIERLGDPLIHLIRNSIDHGIEPQEIRVAAGKPQQGTIHLSALHSGAHVLIQIRDDGAGLDLAAIRAKAVEKGLVPAGAELSEKELCELIFAPGFTTAKSVTGVSGRGVGMDVVKRAIDALRGVVEIETRQGVGTTITLKLPLTLAIIDGFLTRIGSEHFIFPLSLVKECVELVSEESAQRHGRHMANVRGQLVPYIRLREQFIIGDRAPGIEQIVIVGVDGRSIGFVVDTIIGEHQTVLKSLGRFYRDVEGITGATILGDGTVALILDIPKLVRYAEHEEADLIRGGQASNNAQ